MLNKLKYEIQNEYALKNNWIINLHVFSDLMVL